MELNLEFIKDIESKYFRTALDTGAQEGARFIWNIIRNNAGLESLRQKDFPVWDATKKEYVMPKDSNLTINPNKS